MHKKINKPNIQIIGNETQAGTYILRIRLAESQKLQFGRFKKGKYISLLAGDYTYVGSALAEKGSTSLARRLVRHATRSGKKQPHKIRKDMISHFSECKLGPQNPIPINGKKLYWNIDHLLDLQSTEIIDILAIRSTARLENKIAEFIEHYTDTQIVEKSLGANDAPKYTHVMQVNPDEKWWNTLTKDITDTFCPVNP